MLLAAKEAGSAVNGIAAFSKLNVSAPECGFRWAGELVRFNGSISSCIESKSIVGILVAAAFDLFAIRLVDSRV